MTLEAKKQYLTAIRERYRESTRIEKKRILDEFTQVCRYSRKYAIRVLSGLVEPRQNKPGPKAIYDFPFVQILKELWEAMDRPCSKKMVAALPIWLPHFRNASLTPKIERKLRSVSAATIDRLLRPFRHAPQRGMSTTTRSALLGAIPIELLHGKVDQPGFLEADTVSHGGTSVSGVFANSLTLTDLFSGWTENRGMWGKGADRVQAAIEDIERSLPFLIRGFACDNGSEFIATDLLRFFKERPAPVKFVRRRPYKKNDAAHVEQKNWTHVRQLFGYERLDDRAMIALMNEIYRAYWNPLQNYFLPCMKLVKKERIGAKIKKTYDRPTTPCDRLLASEHVSETIKEQLRKERAAKNPFELGAQLKRRLADFTKLVRIACERQRWENDEVTMTKESA